MQGRTGNLCAARIHFGRGIGHNGNRTQADHEGIERLDRGGFGNCAGGRRRRRFHFLFLDGFTGLHAQAGCQEHEGTHKGPDQR